MVNPMASKIRCVNYFHATVRDRPGEAYRLLAELARSRVSLLAFSAVPAGIDTTQLMLFPEDPERLIESAASSGMVLTGPQTALLIQGDDELGALAEVHRKLADASINVYASTGVTDGRGGYGYVLYLRNNEVEAASRALGL